MKQTSVPESVSTQTAVKMLRPSVLVTRSSCSANYCSQHPSENHIKLLGKVYYAVARWNTQETTVNVNVSVRCSVESKCRDSRAIRVQVLYSPIIPQCIVPYVDTIRALVLMPVCCRNTAPSLWTLPMQQISVFGRFVYVLDRVWVEIDTASAAAVRSFKQGGFVPW